MIDHHHLHLPSLDQCRLALFFGLDFFFAVYGSSVAFMLFRRSHENDERSERIARLERQLGLDEGEGG